MAREGSKVGEREWGEEAEAWCGSGGTVDPREIGGGERGRGEEDVDGGGLWR